MTNTSKLLLALVITIMAIEYGVRVYRKNKERK